MSFNYRVVKKIWPGDTETYRIHEVYYDKNGIVDGWSAEPIAPYGETKDELMVDWDMMKAAFYKPVLQEVDGALIEVKD